MGGRRTSFRGNLRGKLIKWVAIAGAAVFGVKRWRLRADEALKKSRTDASMALEMKRNFGSGSENSPSG